VSVIPPRVRGKADSSVVESVSKAMRESYMSMTINIVKSLETLSSGIKFQNTVRRLMTIAHGVPIKVMCVGLNPYEQNIVPSIGTALAYSPLAYIRSTPSVQILSQAMALVGYGMKAKDRNKGGDANQALNGTETQFEVKFAIMLRCSYLCSVVGVAFTNSVPVPVDNVAKRVRYASLFSQ